MNNDHVNIRTRNTTHSLKETQCELSLLSTLGGGEGGYVTRKGQVRFENLSISIGMDYALIHVYSMLLCS
jgi:hypothetical protein